MPAAPVELKSESCIWVQKKKERQSTFPSEEETFIKVTWPVKYKLLPHLQTKSNTFRSDRPPEVGEQVARANVANTYWRKV